MYDALGTLIYLFFKKKHFPDITDVKKHKDCFWIFEFGFGFKFEF